MNIRKIIIPLIFMLYGNTAIAGEVVSQINKKFSIESLTVNVGDTVEFKNEDSFFHNVFSLSDAQMFDLGSYPKGESKSVTFEEAGTIEVECAIHPSMQMVITVK